MKPFLFWSPRVLGILFAAFVSLFALDAFDGGFSLETVIGFLIHLIPVYVLIILLACAWRWELAGAIGFPALAVLFVVLVPGEGWPAYALLAGPLILLGALFLADWLYRRRAAPGIRA